MGEQEMGVSAPEYLLALCVMMASTTPGPGRPPSENETNDRPGRSGDWGGEAYPRARENRRAAETFKENCYARVMAKWTRLRNTPGSFSEGTGSLQAFRYRRERAKWSAWRRTLPWKGVSNEHN
jgi:hypothetical protein